MQDKLKHLKSKSKAIAGEVRTRSKEVSPRFWALKRAHRIVIVMVGVLVIWMLTGIFTHKKNKAQTSGEKIVVKIIESQAAFRQKTLALNGVSRASKVIDIKAETEGIVFSIPVKEGQFLKKGDVISKLDERNHIKQLEAAEADYNRQLLSYNATKATFDKNLSSPIALAEAISRLKNAESQVKAAKDDIEKTISNAPEDGFVDQVYVEEGDFTAVMQSSKIATFLVLNPVQIISYVPEKNIREAIGAKKAKVVLSDNSELEGEIKFLSRAADQATRTYKLEINLDNQDYKILSGQTVKVRVPLGEVASHHIPRSALSLDMKGNLSIKTVQEANVVKNMPVEIVDEDDQGFWVIGLPEKAKIITLGHQYVKDGESVEVNDKVS